jgi:5-hydroxyisourate hydrolase-like protein (transthyretin family)
MRVDVTPSTVEVQPGSRVPLRVSIYNDEAIIVAYRMRVLGLDPSWVTIDEPRLSLFPDTASETGVLLEIPHDAPAGSRRIGIEVTSLTEPAVTEIVEVETTTPSEPAGRLELEPVSIFGTSVGTFGVAATNEGNTPLELEFEGEDPEDHLQVTFDPPILRLAPGERGFIQAVARGRRPFLGNPAAHTFTIRDPNHPTVAPAVGTLIQRARLPRPALSLLGLLAAVTVFALVLTTSLGRVVDRSRASEDLLLEVLRGETDDPLVEHPGSVGGTVTLLTSGAPVSGVTADLFRGDDPNRPIASTATDETGAYAFGNLAEGGYKLRVRGAGFTELWYPAALVFDEAEEVHVGEGETIAGVDVRLGGIPGSITGTVLGDDPGGATVTLQVPADLIDGEVDAVVRSTVVDATGQFTLEEVPAPSSYVLRVAKPGYASGVRLVNIGAGEAVTGVELQLRTGDGSITGTVVDEAGSVGGATIVATSGDIEVRTASLTQDQVGVFTLRDLPTPATYTIQVSATGYATETFAIRLSVAQQVEDVQVRLRGGAGSISGVVGIVGEGPVGGVLVTVSDGGMTFTTESLSLGDVGSYRVDDLPVPGSYTVTFSRSGLATQVRSIDLDAFGGAHRTGLNANLTRSAAAISGTVTGEDGAPLGGVRVTVTSGDEARVTMSAHEPPGRYELRDLSAGTYTVTFERPGSQARAVLVALGAGEGRTIDVVLAPQASVHGRVTVAGMPTSGLQVRLFRIEEYPSSVLDITVTGTDGTYSFDALDAPQTYVVEFLNAGGAVVGTETVTLLAGEQRTGVDFAIP